MTPYRDEDGVTLYQGDCLDVLAALPSGSVDAIVTDPPYKIGQEYSASADPDNLLAVAGIYPASDEMLRVTRPGGICALFYDTRILPLAISAMGHAGWKYMRGLTLYRRWGQASLLAGWMSTSDFILIFYKPGAKPQFHGSVRHDVYIRSGPERDVSGHPAQKPIDAVRHIVSRVTPPGGLVLDPYAGSGTTLIAARDEGFRAIGIEREPGYLAMTADRLAQGVQVELVA